MAKKMIKIPVPQLPLVTFQAKSESQKEFLKKVKENQITIAIGQAGCGKTFASVAYALSEYYSGKYKQIVLIRPLVINEEVGFLKGSLDEKLAPYYYLFEYIIDALVGKNEREKLYSNGAITNISLGFCRGITFNDSFIIADEMQNANQLQFKSLLTRIGNHSKMVITGDIEQIDLKNPRQSGLIDAIDRLENMEDISIHEFDSSTNLRNPLITKILQRYEE